MKKFQIILWASITVVFVSCQKTDDPDPQPTEERPTSLVIGTSTSGVSITDVIPDTTVTAPWNTGADYKIDLNSDNIDDVSIYVYESHIGGGQVLGSAGIKISSLNSETNFAADSVYALAFSEDDTINLSDNWSGDELMMSYYWSSYPPGSSGHDGYWYDVDTRYIGLKYNDRLGWIKLNPDLTSFVLFEYALQE